MIHEINRKDFEEYINDTAKKGVVYARCSGKKGFKQIVFYPNFPYMRYEIFKNKTLEACTIDIDTAIFIYNKTSVDES